MKNSANTWNGKLFYIFCHMKRASAERTSIYQMNINKTLFFFQISTFKGPHIKKSNHIISIFFFYSPHICKLTELNLIMIKNYKHKMKIIFFWSECQIKFDALLKFLKSKIMHLNNFNMIVCDV